MIVKEKRGEQRGKSQFENNETASEEKQIHAERGKILSMEGKKPETDDHRRHHHLLTITSGDSSSSSSSYSHKYPHIHYCCINYVNKLTLVSIFSLSLSCHPQSLSRSRRQEAYSTSISTPNSSLITVNLRLLFP